MKLKKIASLALAGIMAVSMLTACGEGTGNSGENGNGEEVTPSASYTVTVLGDTSDVTQAKLSASSSTTLDKAVAFVANNYTIASRVYLKTPQYCSILPKSAICRVAFACIPQRSAALMRLASGVFWRISQHF